MLEAGEDKGAYVISALGGVGTGKSSLLNAITGEYTFETGDGTDVSVIQ
jgi:putative ribosome biogenesis GTPase RsgA